MIRVPSPFSMPAVISYAAVALFALIFRSDFMAGLAILAGASGATLATLLENRWEILAKLLAWRPVADHIIALSARLEHFDIVNDDGSVYMSRFWVFNPHPRDAEHAKYDWIPFGVRLHHIMRRDSDRARHNHPWPRFRTFILRGWYQQDCGPAGDNEMNAGDTALVRASDYHRIFCVPPEGVWTLVITGRRVSDWGFDVNGKHVPHAEYLAKKPHKLTAADRTPETDE